MNVRHVVTTSAAACLCLAAGAAAAQQRPAGQARPAAAFDLRSLPPEVEPAERQRLRGEGMAGSRRPGTIRSWAVEPNVELGLGRFQVGEIARPRTHTESIRLGPENRSIAGAGLRISFD